MGNTDLSEMENYDIYMVCRRFLIIFFHFNCLGFVSIFNDDIYFKFLIIKQNIFRIIPIHKNQILVEYRQYSL